MLASVLLLLNFWFNYNGPDISFQEAQYDFGEVREGVIVNHKYVFINTGTKPLLILNVQADCGCTAAIFTQHPVLPGDSSHISVRFFTKGREGLQTKTIGVKTNVRTEEYVLTLSGKVIAR